MEKAKARGSLRGRRRSVFGCGVEELERRACPAAISIANVALSEGTNASPVARFTVSLSGKATTPVAVNWMTVDGTATVADNDFLASSGTIVFARGQTSKTVSVYIRGDAIPESDESFSIRLSNAVGATISKAMGTATIRNDDVRQSVVPSLSVSDVDLPERNGGRSDARFTVKLSAATNVPVTVNCATANGTATIAGSDYVATSSKLTFAPGETEKTVAVAVLGDSRIELDETFGLVLSNPRGATIAKATGTATIRNDDFSPPSPVLVTVLGSSVIEGDGDPGPASFAAFTVKLSRAADSAVTVAYQTYDGSATAIDNDYVATTGNLTFAVGETTKTVLVPVVGDTKPERDETFSLVLVSAEGALLERTPARATVIDDDTPPELTVVGVSLPEGNTGSSLASFVISLNRPWTKPVDVTYATRDGSATTADSDYVAARGTVTFGVGEIVKTVSVSVSGDTRAEIDERFFLDLSSANNATIAEGTGTVTIVNDDSGEVPGFQITVDYSGTVRQSIRDACDWAAERWSQVITGDLPGVWDSSRGVFVDDLRITVQEGLLGGGNGPGDALANAGPDEFRSGAAGLPWAASAGIDPFDASDSQLRNIVLHEFGHALGFGISGTGVPTFYSRFVVGDGFTGTNALREYRSLFGGSNTSVPLETGGGAGTAGAHWRESVFNTELMTGYSEAPGVVMPLSAITVGAMQDMGYTVNYAAADPYTPPVQSSASAQQSGAQRFGALGGAVPPNQSARKAASQRNGSTSSGRTLALDAATQAGLATSAQWVESAQRATAKTPRERMFVALATGMTSASERPLSTLAWRALGPA
jgi:hypothetical protein